jgi:hypothetical protein
MHLNHAPDRQPVEDHMGLDHMEPLFHLCDARFAPTTKAVLNI